MKTVIITIAIVLGIIWGFAHLTINGWHIDTGKGQHTGYVTAIEQSGLWWKPWSAYVKTDLSSSQEDKYCVVADNALILRLQEAAAKKEPVKVLYREYFVFGVANCNNGTIAQIYEVQEATE